jgi:hypothetical protein
MVSLAVKPPCGAHVHIFITVWQLRSCFCGVPSLTRGRVCLLYMLLTFASAVFLGSGSLGTRDHILLSQIWDFPFHRLLDSQGHGGGIRPRLHTGNCLNKNCQSQSHIATDSQSVSKSWCRSPSRAHDQIFITLLTATVLFFVGRPLWRQVGVCLLYMLLTLASAVFLWSESLGTRDHILLSHIWDFPFRRLLRLAGSRWRYSTPPPHGWNFCQFLNSSL